MNSDIDLLRLLKLRMLTSALAGHFERTLRDHLSNLAVMLHPRALLGDLIRFEKSAVKDQDAGLRELSKLYLPIARNPAINVQADLKPPLDIHTSTLDLIPASYSHTPEGGSKPITVVTPMRWVLCYKDLGPAQLREFVTSHNRSGGGELQSCLLHYLVLHMIVARSPGVAPILEALRFRVKSEPNPDFGGLPFVTITAPVATFRPSDQIILQSALLSGSPTFEEIVDLEATAGIPDPLGEQFQALVRQHEEAGA